MPLTKQEQFTLDIITRNEYLVRVDDRGSELLEVDYAGKLRTSYQYYEDDSFGIHYQNISIRKEEWIEMPYRIFRLYVLLDIYRQCRKLSLPYSIVWFFDSTGERSDLLTLWSLNLDENETATEKKFNHYIQQFIGGELLDKFDDELEKDGLIHEFNILKGLLV